MPREEVQMDHRKHRVRGDSRQSVEGLRAGGNLQDVRVVSDAHALAPALSQRALLPTAGMVRKLLTFE